MCLKKMVSLGVHRQWFELRRCLSWSSQNFLGLLSFFFVCFLRGKILIFMVQQKHVYDLRQLILTGDDESCSQHIFQYMQAVVDEIVFSNIDPLKHLRSWGLSKLLKEFVTVGGKLLRESLGGISDDTLLNSLGLVNDLCLVDIINFSLPNLPAPPNAFRGIRRKSSSLR
ncbi:hypothetical protein JHK82_024885 [Glycine max]|uniref:SecA Wing/Scaffold domain-containing protein n=1 Tax=Glycine max TaxID=3847 RepID=K7LDG5_SOYBN|nr:hypothetical protein JHK86_025001 [Glycine max]KAG5133697.1 hypothetical protein JHK82_024885 [Glycine max]KAH1042700.1 hypothetical protein GYH30_024822 [Glycine max]KRH38270.1 hypothetical protein GLYMA_09G123400v4 [Glycine max]